MDILMGQLAAEAPSEIILIVLTMPRPIYNGTEPALT
jgi:hypothetical protein